MALVREFFGTTRGRLRLYALGLLPVLLALVPLAHASPPDQTWLAGFYDDADFDDVVMAVVSATAVVSSILPVSPKPADVSGRARPDNVVLLAAARCSAFTIRAPPAGTRIAIS